MSIRLMADVWDNGPDDATLTSVLVVLANSADDSGGNCFPGNSLIAQRTRYSERTVIRALAELERQGWIAILQRRGGRPKRGARKHELAEYHTQFRINVAKLKGCQAVTVSETEKGDTGARKGDIDDRKRVTLTTEKGDIDDNPLQPPLGRTVKDPSKGSVSKKPTPVSPPASGTGRVGPVARGAPKLPPDAKLEAATEKLSRAMDVAEDRERRKLAKAIAQYAAKERMSADEAAAAMVEAWGEYREAWPLRFRWGPVKFITRGHWRNPEGWPWDREQIRQEEARRALRVGVA